MSAYDITEFLRTAYRPFAYCVPSKHPLNTAYQKGGYHPHTQMTANMKKAASCEICAKSYCFMYKHVLL